LSPVGAATAVAAPGPNLAGLAPVGMLISEVVGTVEWWVPTLDRLSRGAALGPPCRAGTGGHADLGGGGHG